MWWSTNAEAKEMDEKNLSDRMQARGNSVVFQLPCKNPVTLQNADYVF